MSLLSYLATYTAGAGSTVAGSWLASKIRVYHDARNSHRDELKTNILQPLLRFLQAEDAEPRVSVDWGAQLYNPNARAQEQPTVGGPILNISDLSFSVYEGLDDALLEDSRQHHFKDLLSDCEKFRGTWSAHALDRKKWVEYISDQILQASGLPAYASGVQSPYVMHLNIALFVYSRLMEDSPLTLAIPINHLPPSLMLDSRQTLAAAQTVEKVREVLALVNSVLDSEKQRASQFQSEAAYLQSKRAALARRFSLALASKRLSHGCPLVTFL